MAERIRFSLCCSLASRVDMPFVRQSRDDVGLRRGKGADGYSKGGAPCGAAMLAYSDQALSGSQSSLLYDSISDNAQRSNDRQSSTGLGSWDASSAAAPYVPPPKPPLPLLPPKSASATLSAPPPAFEHRRHRLRLFRHRCRRHFRHRRPALFGFPALPSPPWIFPTRIALPTSGVFLETLTLPVPLRLFGKIAAATVAGAVDDDGCGALSDVGGTLATTATVVGAAATLGKVEADKVGAADGGCATLGDVGGGTLATTATVVAAMLGELEDTYGWCN